MDIIKNIDKQKVLLAGMLVAAGVLCRIFLHDFFSSVINPITTNGFAAPLDVFFIIATVALLSGVLLGKYYTFIVPLGVITITDIFYAIVDPQTQGLWTTYLFLFTWSGYVIIALLGSRTKRKTEVNRQLIPRLLGAGVLGVVSYDLWTNFGFWLGFSKLGFYPQTVEGLVIVYIGGIPTMLWHLLSASIAMTLVALPLVYFKEYEFLAKKFVSNPAERYIIVSLIIVLMAASIITAIF